MRYYYHAENVASRLVAGETVIVRLPDAEMTILNPAGSTLWSLADGTRTGEDLACELQGRYGLATAPDLEGFLADLMARGLLSASETACAPPRPCPPAPPASAFEPPAVRLAEMLETLASACTSAFTGEPAADCRTIALGCFDFKD